MADDNSKIVYSYEGDVSSLADATKQAISLLNQYDSTMKKLASSDIFQASKTATAGFQRTLNGVIAQVNTLTTAINAAGNTIGTDLASKTTNVAAVGRDLADVLSYLNESTTITSKDLKFLTSVLQEDKAQMEDVAGKAYALSTSLRSVGSVNLAPAQAATTDALQGTKTAMQNVAFEGYKVQQAYEAAGKSANDSAISFLQLERARTPINDVASAVQRLQTDLNLLQAYGSKYWTAFSSFIDPVLVKFQSLQTKTSEVADRVSKTADTVSAAFRRTSASSSDAASAHSALGTQLKSLQSTMQDESKAVKTEENALSEKNKTLKSSAQQHSGLSNVMTALLSVFSKETKALQTLGNQFGITGKHALTFKNILQGITGSKLAEWLSKAINQSIAYTENLNLFTVAMGDAYAEGSAFVNKMAEVFGMDPSNLLRYAGNFYQLADAIGASEEASSALALGLTKAGNDLSSLFNVPIDTVIKDLSSGMMGMSRAVKKYGMDIRATTLQQTALSLGITKAVKNMSEANLQGLRFITMMRQGANASGDFAKTIESPANQLKIFKEQMTQLGRAIGNFFIKPLATAIAYINGFIMAVRVVLQYIAKLLGIFSLSFGGASKVSDGVQDVSNSVSGIGDAASKSAKELKKLIAPFDELTTLDKPVDTSGAGSVGGLDSDIMDPAILKAIEEMQWKLEDVRMKAVKVRDAILEFLGFKVKDGTILSWDASSFEKNLINKFPQWTKTIQAAFDNWTDIVNGFKAVWKSLGGVVEKVWTKITDFISKFVNDDSVSSWIGNLGDKLQALSDWIDAHSEGIANFILLFGGFMIIGQVLPYLQKLWEILSSIGIVVELLTTTIAGLTGPTIAIIALVVTVIATLIDLWNTDEEFRGHVQDAWNSVVTLLTDLWNNILKPVIDEVIKTVKDIYEGTIKPIVKQISEIILTLWSDILQPILSWIIESLGPSISDIAKDILAVIAWVVQNIGGFISGALQIIQGVIDFIAGVFSGDWERAWKGIVNVFAGLFNSIASIVVAVVNVVITVINGLISLVYNAVVSFINLIANAINDIAGMLGFTLHLGIDAEAPQIPYIKAPRVGMATGGVVTQPTQALIGEGTYDEAVIPLGNSPQMKQFADSVASRVNNGEQIKLLQDQNELLRQILQKTGVYLDGKELTRVVNKNQRVDARAYGR